MMIFSRSERSDSSDEGGMLHFHRMWYKYSHRVIGYIKCRFKIHFFQMWFPAAVPLPTDGTAHRPYCCRGGSLQWAHSCLFLGEFHRVTYHIDTLRWRKNNTLRPMQNVVSCYVHHFPSKRNTWSWLSHPSMQQFPMCKANNGNGRIRKSYSRLVCSLLPAAILFYYVDN